MSVWPQKMKVGPIRQWPGALSTARKVSPFRATLTDTLRVLDREIYNLVDTKVQQGSAELLLAIPAGAFRLDGRPRADARAEHPGVIFSIDSRHGHLSYPCDTFTDWQDNLRAIALALEALRKVDRYGVTKRGEQYRGFAALEARAAGPAIPFTDAESAASWLDAQFGDEGVVHTFRYLVNAGKRRTHPDMPGGGDPTLFDLVMRAERTLREAGKL